MFLIALGLAKLSVCASFIELSPDVRHRRMTKALILVIIVWIVTSFFGTAFGCGVQGHLGHLGHEDGECINLVRCLVSTSILRQELKLDSTHFCNTSALPMPSRIWHS